MPEETRMRTVLYEDGKYFLEVEDRREELPVGIVTDEAELNQLVGQEVEGLFSEPRRFVVGLVAREIGRAVATSSAAG